METRCSSRSEKNLQGSCHGNSPLQSGTNVRTKTKQFSQKSTQFMKVDRPQKHESEFDCDCTAKYVSVEEQHYAPNMATSRKPTGQQDVTNTRSSGKRYVGSANKSLFGGPHSYEQDAAKFPTIEQQLEHLIPSKELLLHYREKIVQLNNDYQDLLEKVEQCQSICDLSFQLEKELEYRNSEVSKLQQVVSDLQVYVQQEREQVLRLYTENDRLQVRAAEDRKKIALLLSLSQMTERDIVYLSSLPDRTVVPRAEQSQFIHSVKNVNDKYKKDTGSNSAAGNKLTPEGTCLEATILCAQLEEHVQIHRNQVLSLLKDREIGWKERNLEQRRFQDRISVLASRLKDTQDQLCNVTKELIEVKQDRGNQELKWSIEKNKMLHNLELCRERLGENYPSVSGFAVSGSGRSLKLKSSQQLCAEIDSLKDQLRQRDSLVSMYQEQCIQLNEETAKYREQVDVSKKIFHEQTQKLAGQVTYLKNKFNDLDRRRKLEAEGFYNDIRILRGRLRDMEKTVRKFFLKQVPSPTAYPTNNDLFLTARQTRIQSQQLEKELEDIKRRVEEIETGIGNCTL